MLRRQSQAGDQRSAGRASSDQDEARLVAAVAAGDLKAFETLYRLYHPKLTRFLMNMVHRRQLAEEALDDAMMVVWRRPESFNGTSKVSTWIFAIAYRTALKALSRHDEPREDLLAEQRVSPEASAERQIEAQETHAVLQHAMDQLSADHRAVVDLTYFHEMGCREIAEIMDCPIGTVKTRMHHARIHLRRVLSGRLTDWL